MANYLIAYDIVNNKRRRKIAKIAYSYALGGQKSVLEAPLSLDEAYDLAQMLFLKMNPKMDRIHLIQVEIKPLLLGIAHSLEYSQGAIVL